MFGDVGRRAPVFSAQCQTLEQSEEDEKDGGQDANVCVRWQKPNHRRRDPHRRHGDQKGILATDKIADMSEHQRA